MTRLIEIQDHIGSMSELLDVVGAMRSLAGMRVQEAQRALPAIRHFAGVMAASVGAALRLLPDTGPERSAGHGRRALVLCAAEHGFVGGFNERLLQAAKTSLGPADLLFVLGSRGAALAEQHGRPPAWSGPMATRLSSMPETIGQLEAVLYPRIAEGEISRVELMFARSRQGAPATVEQHGLLPLDLAALGVLPPTQPPLHNLEPRALLERLTAEYLFALLGEAAVESIASENAARFAAMAAAHGNVETKLQRLRQDANQARQTEITEELLDLVTGSQTLNDALAQPRAPAAAARVVRLTPRG